MSDPVVEKKKMLVTSILSFFHCVFKSYLSSRSFSCSTFHFTRYSVMAGTPERMLEHLLESRLDNKKEDEIGKFMN